MPTSGDSDILGAEQSSGDEIGGSESELSDDQDHGHQFSASEVCICCHFNNAVICYCLILFIDYAIVFWRPYRIVLKLM